MIVTVRFIGFIFSGVFQLSIFKGFDGTQDISIYYATSAFFGYFRFDIRHCNVILMTKRNATEKVYFFTLFVRFITNWKTRVWQHNMSHSPND